MKTLSSIVACAVVVLAMSSCGSEQKSFDTSDDSILLLRLRGSNTETDERWNEIFNIIKENPGCCDEVWFSTGLGVPPMEWHQEQAQRMVRGSEQLRAIGVIPSLQIQMTIGHGDSFGYGRDSMYAAKTWTGWTGSTGVEDKYCNCPRQTGFLEYVRQMTHYYAQMKPRYIWIDDDLRLDNHVPATDGSRIGCWCDTCIAAFNAEQQTTWTRETLTKAMEGDEGLQTLWYQFSLNSLSQVARCITEEAMKVSPDSKMALQNGSWEEAVPIVSSLLENLHEVSGKPVGYRPGGGNYYDLKDSHGQVHKSMQSAWFMKRLGNPDYVETWCPEVESHPRVYGGRTAQSALVEGFTALAYGFNAISMFILAGEQEDASIYSYSLLKPIAAAAPMLKSYAKANEGTESVGYEAEVSFDRLYEFGRSGIPVLPGIGRSLGVLSAEDLGRLSLCTQRSCEVQALREELNSRYPSPVVCMAPFVGLLMPRIDKEGQLKTVGVLNTRIDVQEHLRIRLNGIPESVKTVVWYEMKQQPTHLPVEWTDGQAYVEIPEIAAWNVGFLSL